MKNFKLLLGATAILSTGALIANAYLPEDVLDSTQMTVKAEIIKDLNLKVEQHLDFGRIAWDYSKESESERYVTMMADSSGVDTPTYSGVKFHDGGKTGKICFADIVPGATREHGFTISYDPISIKDGNGVLIGDVEFVGDYDTDAGSKASGERCYYIGGALSFRDIDAAKNFSGKIEEMTTITVIYDAVN